MIKNILLALVVVVSVSGCVAVPLTPALIGAAAGFGASALKFDDDIFNYWAARRGVKVVPASQLTPTQAQGGCK